MDNATKRDLKKQDQFVTLTEHGFAWANQNRRSAIVSAALLLIVILAAVGGYALYQHRSTAAQTAYGAAMQTYQTPLVTSGQPLPAGMKSFANANERAAAANAQFQDIAHRYGMTEDGKLAQYYVGLTYAEEGQNASAEDSLKKTASSWNGELAALGKFALAQLYQQTGRDAQAVALYNELASGHATTVPPHEAQLQLAGLYTSEGKTDKAKEIYAKVKDQDKDSKGEPGAAATVAAQKLDPKAAAAQ